MDPEDQYFVFENRLDSFQDAQPVSKGKASTAASRAPKALVWPHKTLSPLALAKAGFFFQPHPKSPDNVVCFLCEKSLDGWEESDNPLEEHLKHSPTCGWAIMAAIEAGYGNYGKVHPLDPAMIEARKATFAGRWPYESKRGFKCKTKKLVEGGWKFTPSGEASDMTTCAYCNLALEGWESDDNPFDEHYRREPGCLFFALINQYPAPKKGRAKAGRASKASRLSVQSVATTVSDIGSFADVTADHDDSVMTTASTATQGGRKTAKGRKPAAGKGRKTKAKKGDDVEILEDEPQERPQPPAVKGRKRASDAMEDHAATDAEAPAPKKRAARGRASAVVDYPSLPDSDMVDAAPAKPPAGKKKARASSKTRKASQASVRSEASTASLRAHIPDDDELDRQLEADPERYNSNEEDMAVEQLPAPTKGRPKKAATVRTSSSQKNAGRESFAMFDPTPMVPDEAEIEADLEALQAEMGREQATDTKPLVVPKRGRKAGTRKASKQTKKAKEPSAEPGSTEEAPLPAQETEQPTQELESEPELEDPDVSTGTVVTKPASRPTAEKRGRGRPSKKSTASLASVEEPEQRRSFGAVVQPQAQPETARSQKPTPAQKNTPVKIARKAVPPPSHGPALTPGPMAATPPRASKTIPYPPSASRFQQPPSTPRRRLTPPVRANQATNLRTRSPQASDAENQPLSLQPAASVMPQRPVLAPLAIAQTPQRSSPSKRNIVSGLQSSQPWQPADLDLLFSSPLAKGSSSSSSSSDHGGDDKENSASVARLLRKGAELTSPEKRMTVEEWIYHNAGLAEQKLKYECEAMVAAFEGEGGRALSVLEGLVVDAA
ncbi:hypothetical protein F5144DRAFT_533770 [Chaetomium tenue]|uniref:Uncharacterized protein n=1 Tax=Chaetomium tenue TaxID=1854479 RepID=A0ACB7P8S7_9PEZI|nr:hypothetical protein F5144DRAFT_533770 [Chaetomium globosum]